MTNKIPKYIKPEKFKTQKIPTNIEPPHSSMMYCGQCGSSINPERFSIMRCWRGHDLEKAGIYEVALKDDKFIEGWRMHHGEWVQ